MTNFGWATSQFGHYRYHEPVGKGSKVNVMAQKWAFLFFFHLHGMIPLDTARKGYFQKLLPILGNALAGTQVQTRNIFS